MDRSSPRRVEPRRGLDEVGARGLCRLAHGDYLLVAQRRRLDDGLQNRPRYRLADGANVCLDLLEFVSGRPREVDDHVNLVGPLGDGPGRFGGLDVAVVRPRGESAHDRELHVPQVEGQGKQRGRDAHGADPELFGLLDKRADLAVRRLRLEQGVVDELGDVVTGVRHACFLS